MKTPETPDPLIDEIRAIRRSLDAETDHDIRKLAARANAAGEEFRRRREAALANSKHATPSR